MKTTKILFLLLFLLVGIVSCDKDDDGSTVVKPVIDVLSVYGDGVALLSDSIWFDADLSDAVRPLSTLEVELTVNDVVISSKSIRTKGNQVSLKKERLFVPFIPNVRTEDEMTLTFTLINVDGGEAVVQKSLKAVRPAIPETIYLVMSDDSVIELYATEENPYLYESAEGRYQSIFTTKVATSPDLAEAEYIWNAGSSENVAAIGERFGEDIKFSYSSWIVSKIIFDALSFTFDVDGLLLLVNVNGVQMGASGDYLYARIDFTKGEEFVITGIEEPEEAYNRDFFAYDPATDTYRFLAESGQWDVYYSPEYNYFWVNRMEDVAPATYWIVGHGFTSLPRWDPGFNDIGWETEDVVQLAYMLPVGGNQYQAKVYLSDEHAWGGFDIQMHVDREWNGYATFTAGSFTGDAAGVEAAGGEMADIVGVDGFIPGYYLLTLDVSGGLDKAVVDFKRLTE